LRPAKLDDALQLLAEHGDDARILAGGQSLVPVLNMRLAHPKLLIDINQIEALKGISMQNGTVCIGALARHVEVMESPIVVQDLPLIAEAMPQVAHVAVRNRGTFGGSIALADPSAELPACILALGARVVLQSTRGRRTTPADEFFHGLYETAREPDELLVEVLAPDRGQPEEILPLSDPDDDADSRGEADDYRVGNELKDHAEPCNS
jgi:carbon-monoxide dehydrogenase medium subunit